MLQGSVHNSWKLKMSLFFHDLHTHQTCQPLSMFVMFWVGVYNSVFQFLPISINFAQRRGVEQEEEEEWDNISEATVNSLINSMGRRCVALNDANGGHTRY